MLAERWRPLQHRQAALLAGLSATGTGSLAVLTMGHGEVETATRFPLLHTPDRDDLNSKINALH